MKRWIAHEHDETGWPTQSCLIVSAATQLEARQLMTDAITAHSTSADRHLRSRLFAIFIEDPRELPADDPRHGLVTDPIAPIFIGFG
jgi:hypothetical protein